MIRDVKARGGFIPMLVPPALTHFSRVRVPMSTDELERQLDGTIVSCAGRRWRLDVFGIYETDGQRWIQLGLEGHDRRTLLLKLASLADDADVIGTVESWLADSPPLHGDVLRVSCA